MSQQNQIRDYLLVASAIVILAACNQTPAPSAPAAPSAPDEAGITRQSVAMVPSGPWAQGDQKGMANTLGAGTWMRCAHYMAQPGAKSYELSHIRSNGMTQSPFGVPLIYDFRPTVGIPGTLHAFNGEQIASGEPAAQGTQMDALGSLRLPVRTLGWPG